MRREIRLPYGDGRLKFCLPEDNLAGVFAPWPVAPCADAEEEIRRALAHPLDRPTIGEIVHPGEKALILVDDHTRVTPVALILPHLLERLRAGGVRDEDVTIMIANGTHRLSRDEEVQRKVGEHIYKRFDVVQHECADEENQVYLGLTSRGTPVWVNRLVVEVDRCFGIGHIDPSTFAGYAGGGKLLVPGVASLDTIDANHSLVVLGFRQHGRVDVPCRLDLEEAASQVRVDVFVNAVLCQDGRIARVFAGSPGGVFREGLKLARRVYEVACPGEVDVAITSGYPYDIDLYQAVRAVQFADNVVREGGSIVLVAACRDGVGSAEFYRLLAERNKKPDAFLRDIVRRNGKVTYNVLGYFLARIRAEKRLYAVTEGISEEELTAVGFRCAASLQAGVDSLLEEYGPKARVAVFPMGSATIPCVS
jgi:nickel-dependent lactate racemase